MALAAETLYGEGKLRVRQVAGKRNWTVARWGRLRHKRTGSADGLSLLHCPTVA